MEACEFLATSMSGCSEGRFWGLMPLACLDLNLRCWPAHRHMLGCRCLASLHQWTPFFAVLV